MRRCSLVAALAIWAAVVATAASFATEASAEDNFYAGKIVQVVVGYTPGGGFDLYARALARYLGRHIPGNPTVVVQNMPGAGSLRAANYIYNAAPADGTVIAEFAPGVAIAPMLGSGEGSYFDATKFAWIGSMAQDISICAFNSAAGIASWHDMQKKPATIGATDAGAESYVFPNMLSRLFDLPFKIVEGYPGSNEIILAMQRHEVDGRCGWSWASLVSQNAALLENHDIAVTLQLALKKDKDLPDVPLVMDLTDDPLKKAVLRLVLSRQTIARPFVAPPAVPAARAEILRQAFDATMQDPAFLDDAKKLNLAIDPLSGAEVGALVRDIYASPRDVVDLATQLVRKSAP
jgi:tripartite-type tricarboxylate transporter receptor subunit TctC